MKKKKEKKLVKFLDKKIALALANDGFSYIVEKINMCQDVYVFVETKPLVKKIKSLLTIEEFSNVKIIKNDTLCF